MKLRNALLATTLATAGLSIAPQASAQVDPYIGQMAQMPYNFCPRGWASTEGQLLPIASYTALFSLLGTQFGGDGRTTFGLPDLRGRTTVGIGTGPGLTNRIQGQRFGLEEVELSTSEMPNHTHQGAINTSNGALNTNIPTGAAFAPLPQNGFTRVDPSTATPRYMNPNTVAIGNTGGGMPHYNMQPSMPIRTCIALVGVFPSRN